MPKKAWIFCVFWLTCSPPEGTRNAVISLFARQPTLTYPRGVCVPCFRGSCAGQKTIGSHRESMSPARGRHAFGAVPTVPRLSERAPKAWHPALGRLPNGAGQESLRDGMDNLIFNRDHEHPRRLLRQHTERRSEASVEHRTPWGTSPRYYMRSPRLRFRAKVCVPCFSGSCGGEKTIGIHREGMSRARIRHAFGMVLGSIISHQASRDSMEPSEWIQ
jgi:hypothetical protein